MRSKQQPRPSFRWPSQQRGDNVPGEDGVESSGPGTDLQGGVEEGDCADEDGQPLSPGERAGSVGASAHPGQQQQQQSSSTAAKEDEEAEAPSADEDDEDEATPALEPSPTTRLNPQALRDTGPPDREPMSPRCPSRDSRESSGPASGGSPPPAATRSSSSPVSPIPSAGGAAIVPGLPAALGGIHPLLPPQSAAMMAAYLQQTHQRLLLGHSPLSRSSVSPLVSSSCSPPAATPGGLHVSPQSELSPSATPLPAVLDFSTRKAASSSTTEEDEDDQQILNLSKPPTPSSSSETNNGPLDLSVPSRKRPVPEDSPPPPPARKSSRLSASTTTPVEPVPAFGSRQVVSPWTSPVVASHFPYFAAAVAAAATSQQQLSPKGGASNVGPADHHQLWNGKMKQSSSLDKSYQPSEAAKALEKMSELSKLGGEDLFRSSSSGGGGGGSGGGSSATSGSRHSAWQSHWLNKGADQAKDVLKCVWCKQSFPTLAAMTTHMKEAKHCGVNMPVPPPPGSMHTPQPSMPPTPPQPHQQQSSSSGSDRNSSNSTSNSKQSPSELNLLIKETMPLPRKLVRGQDVWLGKGAEQTRQILKCMWCGQSFRSLAEMTSHMQQTQHYTNIISQEQIISWKSSDENKGGGGGSGGGGSGGNSGSGAGSGGGGPGGGGAPPGSGSGPHGASGGPGPGATSSHVSAVLTCKVCDQAFNSLKELSNHMMKNSHYKEHMMRSMTESGGRRRQTREKRKKSLPVRKLLELERAQNDFKNGDASAAAALAHGLGKHAGRITCEKCGEKIETTVFVDHIRQCIGAGALSSNNQRNFLKNALMSNHLPGALQESGRKSVNEETSSLSSRHHRSPSSASDATTPGKETPTPQANESGGGGGTSSPSVLNAIEKLIEKSFDSRIRHGAAGMHHAQPGAPIGSSILKRLGIDESVDYTKPLVDPQTLSLLRSYQQQQQHFNAASAARRERSGSESSSISERGSGRTDSMTPERRLDLSVHDRLSTSSHQRSTPDKQVAPLASTRRPANDESEEEDSVLVKKEPRDEEADGPADSERHSESPKDLEIRVKKELMEEPRDDEEQEPYNNHRRSSSAREPSEERKDVLSPQMNPPTPRPLSQVEQLARSPCRNSTSSPTSSDRSVTPRGTPDTKTTSSLGALSSMFDSLSGGGGNSANANATDGQGRKTSSHPLAALQKLCDKTETRGPGSGGGSNRSGSASSASVAPGGGSSGSASGAGASGPTPGAILAFSWACNDAVVTADSIMKCAFCDTPFISKGAYRHHLSKMHFVKDGVIPDALTIGRSAAAAAAAAAAGAVGNQQASSSRSSTSPPTAAQRGQVKSPPVPQANGSPSQPTSSPLEESPHSKFLKYTELAKQLSSKYV